MRKPDVVDRGLLGRAAEHFYDEIGLDRNDPQSFINAGPKGNLKVTSHPDVRATLTESPLACVSRFARTDLDRIKFDVPEDMWKYWAI